MELNRLIRVFRDRWKVVAAIGLIGLVAAAAATVVANSTRDDLYQAVVAIRFEPEEGQTIADLAEDVEAARSTATIAAGDLLSADSTIQADPATAKLNFIGRGSTQEEASGRARSLIQAYYDIDPTVGGAVDDLLAQLEVQAAELDEQMAALQPQLSLADLELQARHDLLDRQITAATDRLVALAIAEAGASAAERQGIAAERGSLDTALTSYRTEKAGLEPRPSSDPTVAERFQLAALQRRLELLAEDYERLFLRKLGVTGVGREEPIVFTNLTPPPASPFANGAVGLMGGVGLAMFALVFLTRTRRPVWLAVDVPVPVLGEVPARKPTTAPGPAWYDVSPGGPRKAAVQALRTAVEGRMQGPPATLTLAGDSTGATATHTLAVDLAASFASAGWSVLLVDADFETPSTMSEFRVSGSSLGDVLGLGGGDDESLRKGVATALDNAVHIRSDLAVLPAGPQPESPGDTVAGRELRVFIEEAMRRFDLVMAIAGEVTSPTAQILMQRFGGGILTIAPGRSTIPHINAVLHGLEQRRVPVLGAVFLQRTERTVIPSRAPEPIPVVYTGGGVDPMSRLESYPFPGASASGLLPSRSLQGLADDLQGGEPAIEAGANGQRREAASEEDSLGSEVLEALTSAGDDGYEAVADYVVSRVEDMLTAAPGQGNLSEDLLAEVTKTGFLSLRTVTGHPSAGDWFAAELREEAGSDVGDALTAEITAVLRRGVTRGDDYTIDDWISQEFFRRHVDRTERAPRVWHLTSRLGAVQVLVNARKLNKERLDLVATEVVRRIIDMEQRTLKGAQTNGRPDVAAEADRRLKDVHLFEFSLGLLHGGGDDKARIVYPWRRGDQQPRGWQPVWSEGILPNLAPVQRLGLLPVPVLTEDEMASLLPTG